MKEFLSRYMGNYQKRTTTMAKTSLVTNASTGIFQIILGLYLLSPWFIINASYYLVLCIARGQLLKKNTAAKRIEDAGKQYNMEFAAYKRSGFFLCMLGISYLFVCLWMYFIGDSTVYRGYAVYLVAVVAFTKLSFAIYGTVINRHLKNPIVSALKMINFTDAMVSIVVTQCTLLTMQKSSQAVSSSALFGIGCSILFLSIGIVMLFKKEKHFSVKEET